MKKSSGSNILFALFLLFMSITPCVSAFSVTSVTVYPLGYQNAGTAMTSTITIGFPASGDETFPSSNEFQLSTDLQNSIWTPVLIIDGVETPMAQASGSVMSISGWILSYPSEKTESLRIILTGNIPSNPSQSQNLLRIAEYDSHNNVISSTVYTQALPATPTPTPTPTPTTMHATTSAPVTTSTPATTSAPVTTSAPASTTTQVITSTPVTVSISATTLTPSVGSIRVSSIPSGANVYLDNEYKGLTTLTMKNIENGDHVVLVKLTGYQDWTQKVTVSSQSNFLSVNLVPLPTASQESTISFELVLIAVGLSGLLMALRR